MSLVAMMRPVVLCIGVAIFAMLSRERGFSIRDLFRTPHDWMMVAYFIWVVVSGPNPIDAFGKCYNVFVFYFVIVQALSSIERIQKFLNWWTALIFCIAALAVGAEYGIDPMGSYDLTHGLMQNRLILNTSLFNNPNALGHSVVPCLMMIYFAWFWKRSVFSKITTIPLVALVLYCIYLTVSKGSFLAGFASIVVCLSFARPRIVQISIVVFAVTVGYGALYNLPRMNELKKAKADPAIEGRLTAWQWGLENLETQTGGIGIGNFVQDFYRRHGYYKASHSSYVQVGTETGYIGLFFFVGILYCNFRTLVFAKTGNVKEERVRRMLFAFFVSYAISSWMVDFAFRATYFLLAAATAAFHRQMLLKRAETSESEETTQVEIQPAPIGFPGRTLSLPAPQVPVVFGRSTIPDQTQPATAIPGDAQEEVLPAAGSGGIKWNRIGIIDIILMVVALFGTVELWRYLMRHI